MSGLFEDIIFSIFFLATFIIAPGFLIWRLTKGWSRFSIWGPSISIYKFSINENDNSDKIFEIYGRGKGFISWLLKKVNLETDFQFYANSEGYYYFFKTPVSMLKEFTPYTQIAGTSCGYSRNINILRAALISILLFFYSLILTQFFFISPGTLILIIIFIIILIVTYAFSKRIILLVESTGSLPVFARFSEGVLDNVKIEFSDIEKIAAILNKNIIKTHMEK